VTAVADGVEDAFRAALEKDAGTESGAPADIPAPPRKSDIADPDAPFGRAENGEPLTPHGTNKKTGKPNLRKPGKPPKDDQARVQAPRKEGESPSTPKRDYSAEIGELVDGTWMLLSSAPVPVPRLRTRIHAQAALINMNKPGLVKGINLMAQNNEVIGHGVEKLTAGSASWVLPAMFALGPFVAQSVMMWRSPAAGDVEELANGNQEAWDATVKSMMMRAGVSEAEEMAA
jgi:hypothetical protein